MTSNSVVTYWTTYEPRLDKIELWRSPIQISSGSVGSFRFTSEEAVEGRMTGGRGGEEADGAAGGNLRQSRLILAYG
jgi:hypothetical protein